jgi:hypothetical protein
MNINCTKCGSNASRRISLVYREGIIGIDTTTGGRGLGVGTGGLAAGGFGSHTKGVHQSLLSKDLSPPQTKRTALALFGVLIAVFVGVAADLALPTRVATVLVIGIPSAWVWWTMTQWNRLVFPKVSKRWENSFICTVCGNMFVPTEDSKGE